MGDLPVHSITLICKGCGVSFTKDLLKYRKARRLRLTAHFYHDNQCRIAHQPTRFLIAKKYGQ